jgi:hypothetical protein
MFIHFVNEGVILREKLKLLIRQNDAPCDMNILSATTMFLLYQISEDSIA